MFNLVRVCENIIIKIDFNNCPYNTLYGQS